MCHVVTTRLKINSSDFMWMVLIKLKAYMSRMWLNLFQILKCAERKSLKIVSEMSVNIFQLDLFQIDNLLINSGIDFTLFKNSQ